MTRPILYPPTIIGHITDDITDLYKAKLEGKSCSRVYFGCQLNGKPHLGTAISLMLSYALASRITARTGMPSTVVFGALENGPGTKIQRDGITYQLMLCDTKSGEEQMTLAEKHMKQFASVLEDLTRLSGIEHVVESYAGLQSKPLARETLLNMMARESEFVPLLNPSDDRLRIRFRCPSCNYEEKHSRTLKVLEHIPNHYARLEARCFDHGPHSIWLSRDSPDFVDVNTMIRNVMKEVVIANEADSDNAFPLIVKGADWSHAATLVSSALELLGYDYRSRPERISTPMLEDWSGAKFSKSVYVKEGSYSSIPETFLSLEGFTEAYGKTGFEKLFRHVCSWTQDPKKFYRNYTVAYLQEIFDGKRKD